MNVVVRLEGLYLFKPQKNRAKYLTIAHLILRFGLVPHKEKDGFCTDSYVFCVGSLVSPCVWGEVSDV
jgi:hypothetical protein